MGIENDMFFWCFCGLGIPKCLVLKFAKQSLISLIPWKS